MIQLFAPLAQFDVSENVFICSPNFFDALFGFDEVDIISLFGFISLLV